jgi:hypothetical protein
VSFHRASTIETVLGDQGIEERGRRVPLPLGRALGAADRQVNEAIGT